VRYPPPQREKGEGKNRVIPLKAFEKNTLSRMTGHKNATRTHVDGMVNSRATRENVGDIKKRAATTVPLPQCPYILELTSPPMEPH